MESTAVNRDHAALDEQCLQVSLVELRTALAQKDTHIQALEHQARNETAC